jgi:transposase
MICIIAAEAARVRECKTPAEARLCDNSGQIRYGSRINNGAAIFMGYVQGEDRFQAALLPAVIDDYVDANASVRVIEAFVSGLDMVGLGFLRSVSAATGRPPYDPRDLLKLYVYGYFNEVRSSRKLERECQRNVEAMWLLKRLSPDFKTIADFRRDNGPAIVATCRNFVQFCRETGLFQARLVALDGSKFQAAASAKRVMNAKRIAEETAQLERSIATYLSGLDQQDASEPGDAPHAVKLALARLESRRAEFRAMSAKLETQGRSFLVDGEDDARPMGKGNGPKPPSYNVQTAVDADTGLIIHHEVTDEATDNRLLHPMALATMAMLGRSELTVVADTGYSNGAHATACEADGITACVPANRAVNNQAGGQMFDRNRFSYDHASDSFTCPAGRAVLRKQVDNTRRQIIYSATDCAGCALKSNCTTAPRRLIKRHFDDDALTRMNERANANLMRQRRCAVEHPFGTLKRKTQGGRFLTRNLKGSKTEMALSVLAYNILRAINIKAAMA